MRPDWVIGPALPLLLLLFVSCHATTTPPVCQDGYYGASCQSTCGHCSDTKCDRQTGNCVACAAGYNFTADPQCRTVCSSGTFGSSCSGSCSSHCNTPGICNHISGTCTPCQAGWTGTQCTGACQNGKYGLQCAQTCGNCNQNAVCDKVTGHCPAGCAPGYDPADLLCKKVCDNGKYGAQCGQSCGNCKQNAVCDKVTGHCPAGCAPGYDPADQLCKTGCNDGKWGQDCQQTCSEHCTDVCQKTNGVCTCEPGYQPSLCTASCDDGKWGQNCQRTCSVHCTDVCQKANGVCTCERGYQPSLCTAECSDGRYGQDCVGICGFCHGGNANCDHVTGNCSRCQDNRVMPLCVDCFAGHWGPTCGQLCGQCGGNGSCDPDDGTCHSSACLAGWTSPECDVKCVEGTYGEGCALKCGQCRNNSPCRRDNGVCEQDCEDGYTGVLCKTEAESLVGPIVGSVMGAAILIALAIVIVAFCYMRRFSAKRPETPNKDFIDTHQTDNGSTQHEALAMRDSQVYQNVPEASAATPGHTNYDQTVFGRQDSHAYATHTPGQAPAPDPSYHTYQNTGSNNNQLPKHSVQQETPEGNYGNVPSLQAPESAYGNVPAKSGGRGKY